MKNRYEFSDDGKTCRIYFNSGTSFIIDASDFTEVSQHNWFEERNGYPSYNTSRKSPEGRRRVTLHRFLMKPQVGVDIDHISGDRLDNRRCNLRVCSHQENMFNQKTRNTNSSGFNGVSFQKSAGKYAAYINQNEKKYHLGLFDTAEEAAAVRDKAAAKLYREFARFNLPVGVNTA